MDVAETVIDFLDVLAWPVVVLVLAGLGLVLFRTQLGALIDRIHELSLGAGKIRAGAPPQDPQPAKEPLEELEEFSQEDGRDGGEAVSARLSTLSRELSFERIYRTIYGTQIVMLQHLELHKQSTPGHLGFTVDDVRGYYRMHESEARKTVGIASPWDQWLSYMTLIDLIELTAGRYTITQFGREFLLYVLQWRLPPRAF